MLNAKIGWGDVRIFIRGIITIVLFLITGAQSFADQIDAGHDLITTQDGHSRFDFFQHPVPADFFGPGSDPFLEPVYLTGFPPVDYGPCFDDDLSFIDMIVERKTDANLPDYPTQSAIPVEIVALSLYQEQAITVTYDGGNGNPENWVVQMSVSTLFPSVGTFQFFRETEEGGFYTAVIQFCPVFTFTRPGDAEVRVWDWGEPRDIIILETPGPNPWEFRAQALGSCTSNVCLSPVGLFELISGSAALGGVVFCINLPDPPTNVTVHYSSQGNTVDWNPTPGAVSYRIYRDETPEFDPTLFTLVAEVPAAPWVDQDGSYGHYYKVTSVDESGAESEAVSPSEVSGVPGNPSRLRTALLGNHPNPFNPRTEIAFQIEVRGEVHLKIFDMAGRLVKVAVGSEIYEPGYHEVVWMGVDDEGRRVASGTYFYRLEAGSFNETKMMVLVK